MAEPDSSKFTCPHCGKGYRWKPEIAGRKLTCRSCEAKVRAPASPGEPGELLEAPEPPPGEGDIYELDLPDDEPAASEGAGSGGSVGGGTTPGKCPSCNQPMKPGAVLCLNCGFNVQAGERIKTVVGEEAGGSAAPAGGGADATASPSFRGVVLPPRVDQDALAADIEAEHHKTEWTTPLILAGVGVAMILVNALALWPGLAVMTDFSFNLGSATADYAGVALFSLAYAALRFVVQMPTFFVGVLIVSWFYGTSFGSLWSGLLKLAALALFTSGIGDLLSSFFDYLAYLIGFGGGCYMTFLRIFISILIFDVTAMKLFDIEQGEATLLWFVTVLLPIVFMIFVGGALLAMLA